MVKDERWVLGEPGVNLSAELSVCDAYFSVGGMDIGCVHDESHTGTHWSGESFWYVVVQDEKGRVEW